MYRLLDISGSGMTANKVWLDLTGNNVTNMNTTRTENGGPYHRQTLTFESKTKFDSMFQKELGNGVKVDKVVEDPKEKLIFDPQHPDANQDGYVRMPDVNMVAEMTNMLMAQRAYEGNVTVLNATKKIMQKEHEIGRV